MRLDARNGDTNWFVWEAEKCCELRPLLWLDDETNEYYRLVVPMITCDGELVGETHRARKIDIYVNRKLVIINPVEDNEDVGADAIATILLVNA